MRLIFLGFGTVGQGLAELLVDKKSVLARQYGFKPTVVGIADMLKGNVYNPKGINLKRALALAKAGQSLNKLPGKTIDGHMKPNAARTASSLSPLSLSAYVPVVSLLLWRGA